MISNPSSRARVPSSLFSTRSQVRTRFLRSRATTIGQEVGSYHRTPPLKRPSTPVQPGGINVLGARANLVGAKSHAEESRAVAGGRESDQNVQMNAPAASGATPATNSERGERRAEQRRRTSFTWAGCSAQRGRKGSSVHERAKTF